MKFYGKVGYGVMHDEGHGVFKPKIVERDHYGDVIRNTRRFTDSGQQNDNLEVPNEISIVGDSFAYENVHNMRYLTWMGAKWKISTVSVQMPRLVCTLGGVWNGPEAEI